MKLYPRFGGEPYFVRDNGYLPGYAEVRFRVRRTEIEAKKWSTEVADNMHHGVPETAELPFFITSPLITEELQT